MLVVAAPMRVEARALRCGDPALRVVRTGMGKARSLRAAERLRREPVRAIAVAGVCGALDDRLEVGDLFVPSELRGIDAGDAVVPLETQGLVAALARAGFHVDTGPLVSTRRLHTGKGRRALAEGGARAADMESLWLAPAAAGRPFAVLRAVMDSPSHEIWTPVALVNLFRALAVLRRAAPALLEWARAA